MENANFVWNIDFAWAAGFFDGEGCVMKGWKKGHHRLRVMIVQNDRQPLEWLKTHFGGTIEKGINHGRAFRWVIEYKKARDFLTVIRPYSKLQKNWDRYEAPFPICPPVCPPVP